MVQFNMNSKDIMQKKEFSDWVILNPTNVKEAPFKTGVYIFRKKNGQCFGRLQGESDILYVGCTESKKGLRQRLNYYLKPGPTQWTNRRINQLLGKYGIEVSWCISNKTH